MELTQRCRGRWLEPTLSGLTRCGVSPDQITLVSLASGLTGCGLWLISPAAALACIVLHIVLDGLDGPLARHQAVASPRGSFTDTMADQAVVTAVTVMLMIAGRLAAAPGGGFIFLYAVVALFAMARNALGRPYAWLVRPRMVFYAWIPLELWLFPGTLNALIWCCNALLACCAATGFVAIRRRLGGRE
jgi:phosphatidylglycerophosphate synthase